MSYKYYRFHLLESESMNVLDKDESTKEYQQILDSAQGLGIVRTALDLYSPNKSISILCQSNEDLAIQQAQLTEYLLSNKIPVSTTIDSEVFEEEKHCDENHHHDGHQGHHHSPHHDHHHGYHDHHHGGKKGHKHHNHHHSSKKGHNHDHHGHHHDHPHDNHWFKAALGLVWGIGLLIISLASFNIPMIAYYIMTGLSALMTLYLGRSVYLSAWKALREKRWDMTTLYSISTLAIVVVSILSTFVPGLPLMFETAPLVLGFWHLGEGIEHTLLEKINTKMDVRDCLSPSVRLKNSPDKESPITTLIPNDVIIIKSNEVIPVDGVLTHSALLYTTRIDGSPYLKEFKAGDAVKAGMSLAEHIPTLELRVSKTYQNSYLSSIAQNINQAHNEKAPVERFANKILKYFVPGLLAVAVISGIVIGAVFNPALAIQCVISVLVSACPCTLSLITPLAVKIGMKKAAEKGIHFKNGVALQAAADIDTVVFDLNGTLTQGEVSVKEIHIADKKLLASIALLEHHSNHPIAKIIKTYIEQQGITVDPLQEVAGVDQSHHSGIKGVIQGETYMIGNKDMLRANGITQIGSPYDNPENGSIYIVRGTSVIGQINLTDPLRKDAIATVKQLKALGKNVQIHICTGADKATAERYAQLLDIPSQNICANAVGVATEPGEVSKTGYITQLKRKGLKVAMVGDAANDIAAIASAHIGIAVKSSIGDTLTEQHAGIVVQKGLLFPIATAFDASKKTKRNIFQNLFVSLTYNSVITLVAAGLFVALGFTLNPALGIALMVLESAIVLANVYRLKQKALLSKSTMDNKPSNEEPIEETTSKVLHSLGYQHQPEQSVEVIDEPSPVVSGVYATPFFSNKNSYQPQTQAAPVGHALTC